MTGALEQFASEVGPPSAGPVVAVGGRTQYLVGGAVDDSAREVRAPGGVVLHEPADMTVRVRAGTPVHELDRVLAEHGQCVALPGGNGATVGGVLAVGHSGLRRLGYGPVRDTVLQVTYVSADGNLVKAGGPTVKNVSGYDLCRVLVGSLGTLGLVAEVILRTRPLPPASAWFTTTADPFELLATLYRPVSVLWDGTDTWLLLEGHADDVAAEAAVADAVPADGPPPLLAHRWSLRPGVLRDLPGDGHGPFLAQLGVGVVLRDAPPPRRDVEPSVAALNRAVKQAFDPTGRLAPGRDVLAA